MGNSIGKQEIKCDKCNQLGIKPMHFRKNITKNPDAILIDQIPLYDNEIKYNSTKEKIEYEYICSNGHRITTN